MPRPPQRRTLPPMRPQVKATTPRPSEQGWVPPGLSIAQLKAGEALARARAKKATTPAERREADKEARLYRLEARMAETD